MAASGVPAGCGESDQDQGGDEHGGGAAVLSSAERAAGLDDASGRRADRPGVGACGPDVAAGGAFEGGRQECLTGWDSVAAPALWGDTALGVVLLLKPHHDITTDITGFGVRYTLELLRHGWPKHSAKS